MYDNLGIVIACPIVINSLNLNHLKALFCEKFPARFRGDICLL